MKKTYIIIILLLTSCSEEDMNIGFFNSTLVELEVFNQEGVDLLNTNNPDSLDLSEIKISYEIDGQEQIVYNHDMLFERGYDLRQRLDGTYYIAIELNTNFNESTPRSTTFIYWNELDKDTFITEFVVTDNSIYVDNCYLNEEKDDRSINEKTSTPKFKIIK
ncbi:hypothetical protein N9L20_07460 [Flavobacteriaceae bacterium]|nr:hypothetical protein [Flavobacteriaceae bacterium]